MQQLLNAHSCNRPIFLGCSCRRSCSCSMSTRPQGVQVASPVSVRHMPEALDAIISSFLLAHVQEGSQEDLDTLAQILEPLDPIPVICVVGNHDLAATRAAYVGRCAGWRVADDKHVRVL